MNLTTKHIVVKGKVQGVFFRKHTKKVADELNIQGWVKNTYEGHVEIIAHGMEDAMIKLIEWCRQGPPKADVSDITVKDIIADESFKSFYIYRE
ncbi:MAG: acylphosphatase [Parafilimonas sp.]